MNFFYIFLTKMYFVKIDTEIVEYVFENKKDAVMYLVDHLERLDFDDPVKTLKEAEKVNTDDTDIIRTSSSVFKIFKMYQYRKCTLCEESMSSKHTLGCEHNVCIQCLTKLRKNECPICRKELTGKVITDEILCNILQRTEIDDFEFRQQDELMALATEMGYNPNDLY